jgi:hypothetical protein
MFIAVLENVTRPKKRGEWKLYEEKEERADR